MAAATRSGRPPGTWIVAAVALAAVVLGIGLVGGLGIADEAGRPLGVPAVSVTPGPSGAPTPSPTPDDSPDVVDGPPPVTVDLDDHGGDNGNSGSNGSNGSGDDNSGKGGGSDD